MAIFTYKGLRGDGAVREGEFEAGGRQDAFRQMESMGLRPIRLAERQSGTGKSGSSPKPSAKGRVEKGAATSVIRKSSVQ